VDGFRLAYDHAGSGPPVVALHGWPGSRRDYREVVVVATEMKGVAKRKHGGHVAIDRRVMAANLHEEAHSLRS